MILPPTDIFSVTLAIVTAVMVAALFLAFYRLVRGPSLADRVLALDLITTLTVGIIAIYAVITERPVFIRPALVLALISFLATIAFAYYVEQRGES